MLPDKQDDSYNLFPDHDLPHGYELRLTAFKDAWLKCLTRIQVCPTYSPVLVQWFVVPQELNHALHAPVVDKVLELVTSLYVDVLPGLPCTELPVITISSKNNLRPPTMCLLMRYLQQTVLLQRSLTRLPLG